MMLKAYKRFSAPQNDIVDFISLDHDTRKKTRIKTTTEKGEAIGVFLERGQPLAVGEIIETECGKKIAVKCKAEAVCTARTDDWFTFAKICYHLGNRHTVLQIGEKWLRFKPDHVLAELVTNYGLTVDDTPAIFAPENGAYSHGKHSHD